jgi:glycosyltransferase involved in cell wall biosynthesis
MNLNDSDNQNLLVSIITVVRNGNPGIEETILSVIKCLQRDAEYIVIDGGSTDGTLDILKKHAGRIQCFISEKDNGIYDAINKGISISKGHFFIVINSGDLLLEIPFDKLKRARKSEADIALFNVALPGNLIFKSSMGWRMKFTNSIHHQGTFYARKLNIQYDLRYKVFSDFDMNQKLYLNKKKATHFDSVVSFHSDGISNKREHLNEFYQVIINNFGFFYAIVAFVKFKSDGIRKRLHWLLSKGRFL